MDNMVRLIEDAQPVALNNLPNLYPLCSYLVKIDNMASKEGVVLAVSDSVDTDREIADLMHDYLSKNILCFIGGDHVHDGVKHVIGGIS